MELEELEVLKKSALQKLSDLQIRFYSVEDNMVDLVDKDVYKDFLKMFRVVLKSMDKARNDYIEKISRFDTRCEYDESITDNKINTYIEKTKQRLCHLHSEIAHCVGMFLDAFVCNIQDSEVKSLVVDKINQALVGFNCSVRDCGSFYCIEDDIDRKIIYNEVRYKLYQYDVKKGMQQQGGEGQGM
jgi:hypothetical protein